MYVGEGDAKDKEQGKKRDRQKKSGEENSKNSEKKLRFTRPSHISRPLSLTLILHLP